MFSSSLFVSQCASTFRELGHYRELFLLYLFAPFGEIFMYHPVVDDNDICKNEFAVTENEPEFQVEHVFFFF